MQVILMERIERLGRIGEVVTVMPGYARNYLLPQPLATETEISVWYGHPLSTRQRN